MDLKFNKKVNDDNIRTAKQQWEETKAQFKQMTPKDVVMFILVVGTLFTLIGLAIYGGETKNNTLMLIGVIGFVALIGILAISQLVIKSTSVNAIKKSPMAQDVEGTVMSYGVYSSASVNNRVSSLTLKVQFNINGVTSQGYYKLKKEEINEIRGLSRGIGTGNFLDSGLKELMPIKVGDKYLLKYIPNKPKTCLILEKIASVDSCDYNNEFSQD